MKIRSGTTASTFALAVLFSKAATAQGIPENEPAEVQAEEAPPATEPVAPTPTDAAEPTALPGASEEGQTPGEPAPGMASSEEGAANAEPLVATDAAPPGQAAAEEPAGPEFLPLAVSGSLWSRYEMRSGYDNHGLSHPRLHREGDYIVSRARIGFSTNPVDVGEGVAVSATIAPQAAYTFGVDPGPAPTVSDHPGVALYEGFARVGTESYQLDAGRFRLDYGDALIIGDLGWNEAARAFNGARLRLTPGGSEYYIDALATIISEGRAATLEPVSGDVYFYGLYAGLGPLVADAVDLDVYVLGRSFARNENIVVTDPADDTVTAVGEQDGATEITIGSRIKGSANVIDYRAEVGVQFGQTPVAPTFAAQTPSAQDKFAYQVDAEVGVKPVAPLRLGVEGLVASGDDLSTPDDNEGYNHLYPTAHKFLGLMDVTGPRTNVASAVLHVAYRIIDPLTLKVDGHYFTRLEAGADGKDGTIGEEVDVNLIYAIGKGFVARGLYGVFLPNEDFWDTKAPDPDDAGDPLHYVEVQFGYNFK